MHTGQLPKLSPIFGRVEETAKLSQMLGQYQIVSLVGSGGIGKTTVAKHLAGASKSKAAFVDLSGSQTISETENTIREALTTVGGRGSSFDELFATSQVGFLVLDHADRALDWVGEYETTLRTHCQVLLTARVATSSGATFRLGSLDEVASRNLFAARLRLLGREVEPEDPELIRIVSRFDGLPLALELAANEMHTLSFRDFEEYLDEAYSELGDDDGSPLQKMFSNSWAGIGEGLQIAIGRLALIVGRFSIGDIQPFFDEPKSKLLKTMMSLERRSLVASDVVGDRTLFQLLEPIRVLALQFFESEYPEAYREAVRRYANRWLDLPSGHRATSVISVFKHTGEVDPELAVRLAIRALTPIHFRHERASRFLLERVFALCETEQMEPHRFTLHCLATELFAAEWRDFEVAKQHLASAKSLIVDDARAERWHLAAARLHEAKGDLELAISHLEKGGATHTERAAVLLSAGRVQDAARLVSNETNPHGLFIADLAETIESGVVDFTVSKQSAHEAQSVEIEIDIALYESQLSAPVNDDLDRFFSAVETPQQALDIALSIAIRDQDKTALTHLAKQPDWAHKRALHAVVNLALIALQSGHPLQALEHAKKGLSLCADSAERALVSRLAAHCAELGGDDHTAAFLSARTRKLGSDLLEAVDVEMSPPQLWKHRARYEQRVSLWSWVAWAPKILPLKLPNSEEQTFVWKVSDEARWVQTPTETLNLSRRGPMRKILWHLVQMREREPGVGTDVNAIFDVAWPGEVIDHDLMLARVYNSIRALRGLGFEEVILTHDDGYLLDPTLEFSSV